MYVNYSGDKIIFNLHLDQKKPSYVGAHKHNAEYEGEIVEAEIKRLKSLLEESRDEVMNKAENSTAKKG
ncbi:hypothetical protein COY23_00130 [bacterium (Candidatus Torokbacteria) CG_4_10_14_0_2_um_filter_35_8]|uniref:Uncharacterized protein n=1 Tax=Candidatus Sherwoodlollariibacterium unditelluris TaxID=1974757 RepID=A0A2G9YIM2_9BACT|nr:MAG: hypothetical protein COX41_04590 [Candidatus Omnitrophica bacterium CG23_combo_of_CG06-09_8_20_14_all_41_10]PIZ58900.1 MAG: hypothetical protein COY23_00130 [bacterium (Candidatus Torokbacteria) CG_4_10_14_0_2_um_filter_35_8]